MKSEHAGRQLNSEAILYIQADIISGLYVNSKSTRLCLANNRDYLAVDNLTIL